MNNFGKLSAILFLLENGYEYYLQCLQDIPIEKKLEYLETIVEMALNDF